MPRSTTLCFKLNNKVADDNNNNSNSFDREGEALLASLQSEMMKCYCYYDIIMPKVLRRTLKPFLEDHSFQIFARNMSY
jgi:hypothetical protein